MDLNLMIAMLGDKDTSKAYEALKELERLSEESNVLYPYMDKFIEMIKSEKYVIRVRGFRLFCKQSRWDSDYKIDENLTAALEILNDEKPTAVRQALAALKDLVLYKKELAGYVREKASSINYFKYKDTMHSLIAKDIQDLLKTIEQSKIG